MMKNHLRVNTVILNSIPLNRKVKRYWISKYERIAQNCGVEEACKKFKQLRVALLNYRADPHRKSNQDRYVSQCGFRTNGMLRALFEYADCQPQYLFSFLKMYTAPTKDRKVLSEVREETHLRLNSVKANPVVPKYLVSWLSLFRRGTGPRREYKRLKGNENHPLHAIARSHSDEEFSAYWYKWRNILRNGWKSARQADSKQVFPEIYKDYSASAGRSSSYEDDFRRLVAMHLPEWRYTLQSFGGLSDEDINVVDGVLDEDVAGELHRLTDLTDDGVIRDWLGDDPFLGIAVGQVQHLPKKGGGTDYRDIAVPNRFIQAALEPCANRLYHLLGKLPKDATYDQFRFDRILTNRVTNDCLYQGSVDLSKATDNLPRNWGVSIVEFLMENYDLSPEERLIRSIYGDDDLRDLMEVQFRESWTLFKHVSGANWEDEGVVDTWKVGQPLGSLPSFALLGITHNLLVEAMGCSLGLLHSPYVTLGDDIVIFNAKLRKKYIRELTSRSVPLSLHKSYTGELSEFAGKLYVKNCLPFYCSDHNPLTWNSLFDWQRATGIRIPWHYLPRQLQRHYRKIVAKECKNCGLPSKSVNTLVDSSYQLIQNLWILPTGSSSYQPLADNSEFMGVISEFFTQVLPDGDVSTPTGNPSSGITMLAGRPVSLLNSKYARKDGWFMRFRPTELPSWYKVKFRPCTTDKVIRSAVIALTSEHP